MAKADEIMRDLDYRTFIRIIDRIPSCIFFKDTDLKYRFSTHFWEQLQSTDIMGKTDLDVRKDTDNAILAMEADREIIRTGKGCSYTIKSDIDGNVTYLELIKEPVFDDDGSVLGIVGLINDVTDKTLLDQKLMLLSTTDIQTGLLNRNTGTDRITERLKSSAGGALCMMDMNCFKSINDCYGHQMGDEAISRFGAVLKASVTESDIAMRLGGDEFMVFLDGVNEKKQAEEYILKLYADAAAIEIPGFNEKLTLSIGLTFFHGQETFDNLYSAADHLMYQAKRERGGYAIG